MEELLDDERFYADGVALLSRDFKRAIPFLLSRDASLTARERHLRDRVLLDLRALLPFSMLVVNTFPLSQFFVKKAVETPWLNAEAWLLPSSFAVRSLELMRRVRRKKLRAASEAKLPECLTTET